MFIELHDAFCLAAMDLIEHSSPEEKEIVKARLEHYLEELSNER